ncbi:MAG: ABC transporter substrate-binding protein [Chloroflexota bacterium]|nr:ABC transporter substrate-binding protein [Chloroflexota bacterium]
MRDNENYWRRLRRRPVTRRSFLVGSGVAAAGSAAILAGCGDDDDDDDDAAAPAATQAAAEEQAAAATEAAAEEQAAAEATEAAAATQAAAQEDTGPDRHGGTLLNWKTEEDAGLDPGVFHLNNREIHNGTMTQPYTYQATKNLIAMDGMVGFEQVDPTTFVWSVRPGMKFHNGDPVDAEAVAFSFGRLEKLYRALDGTHTTRTGYAFVDSFDATDELTVTESWARPNADAPVYRAAHYYSFLNPRMVDEFGKFEGSYERPDGTVEDVYSVQELPAGSGSGPYTMTKRDSTGTRIERWPDYHKHTPADDGFVEDGPYIDSWETRIIPDAVAAKAAFLAGDLDVFTTVDPLEVPEFEGQDHVNIVEIKGDGGLCMQGMDGGKFHDKRSRQALQKSLDYEGFIAAIRPLGGQYAAPITDLLPAYQKLSQQELQEWYRFDPAEAQALWQAADFEVPVDNIKIFQSTGAPLQHEISDFLAQSIEKALGPIGITAEVEAVDGNSWAARAVDRSTDVKDWEILSYGTGDRSGTDGIPNNSFLINYDPRAYGFNAFNHYLESPRPEIAEGSATIIEMLNAQEAETDPEARGVLLTELQRWILDNHWCNWRLPVSSISYFGFSSRLQDQGSADWLNGYSLRRESMWLEQG